MFLKNNQLCSWLYQKFQFILNRSFYKIAKRCEMGDVKAMFLMFEKLRENLPDNYKAEEAFQIKNEDLKQQIKWLNRYINEHDFKTYCRIVGAFMWLNRAAIYGSEEARQLIKSYPLYEEASYLSIELQTHSRHSLWKQCPGVALRLMGLLNFTENAVYYVQGLNENNIYSCYFVVDYDPADDDGFGRENYFNYYYFDEFFCLLYKIKRCTSHELYNKHDKIKEICEQRKKKIQQKREKYWERMQYRTDMQRYNENVI